MHDSSSKINDSFTTSAETFAVIFTFMDTRCIKKSFPNSQRGLKRYCIIFSNWEYLTSNMRNIFKVSKKAVPDPDHAPFLYLLETTGFLAFSEGIRNGALVFKNETFT